MKKNNQLVILCLLSSLTACKSWFAKDQDAYNPYEGMTASQLYKESQKSLKKEQYTTAAKQLEAMETMYPFSKNTEKAQLDLIYAYYKAEEYPSAAASAERFMHLYPRSKRVDYAYYMKAMSNFNQSRGVMAKYFAVDESLRDPGTQSQAYSDFSTLIQRFPSSQYKASSLQHMIYLRNMFADRELHAAEYYYQRKMYVAAQERASALIKTYPQAPSVPNALKLLRDSNKQLGLKGAAAEAEVVLQASTNRSVHVKKQG
jgi:outer membrane protein assembly factor BamD